MSPIGDRFPRVDAHDKVTGKARYPGDFQFSDALYMQIVFARRPSAIVKRIDTSKAEALDGVLMVLTAKDVPNNEYGLGVKDQPVLCGPGSNKQDGDHVRFEGDQVALVIAESEQIAKTAAKLIEFAYEDLPIVETLDQALAEDAFILHPNMDTNIFHHNIVRRGDIEAAFKECAVIVEHEYNTPVQEHAYLQPEAGVAYIDEEERITLLVGGQWTHEDQEQVAHSLEIPEVKIRVIYPAIGGAFGGREDMSVQIVLCLVVMRLNERGIRRPIKTIWSREESIIGHAKRHHYRMWAKWGASAEGKLLAAECRIHADGGAYVYTSPKVLGNATLLATGPYEVDNLATDAYCVYTNNIPGGAFRGFGGPQATFMAESQMDRLAEALGMDPVELRMRNLFKEGSIQSMGGIIPQGVSIREVVTRSAEEGGWKHTNDGWVKPEIKGSDNQHIKLGLGFACGYKNIGFSYGYRENCGATIELYGDKAIERAVLYHSGAEVGQGAHTVFLQFAAEALGLPETKIETHYCDTATSLNAGSASASRMTFMAGNSIKGAAKEALELWNQGQRPVRVEHVYYAPPTSKMDKVDGHCIPNFAYGYVAETVLAEVNTQTGEVHLREVICTDDVGKAINPALVEGQIEGAIVQAAGYTLIEDWKQHAGKALTKEYSTYMIPTILDIPDKTTSIILEYPDPIGPYGARGMAEMPYLPFAPAVISAVEAAIGVRFDTFPLTAERVLRSLGKIG